MRKVGCWVDEMVGGWVDQWAAKRERRNVVVKVAHWVVRTAVQMVTPAAERSVGNWAENSVAAKDDWKAGCSAERWVS